MLKKKIVEKGRTAPQCTTNGASHNWETNMEDTSQMRGHAEMPSTVAKKPEERLASREKEQMKLGLANHAF